MNRKRADLPFVSIVMPILNEARYIEACLAALYRQDYPHDRMEIIIADGMSDDGTRAIVGRHVDGYRPETPDRGCSGTALTVRMIDNPGRIVSTGLNAAILAAEGEIIVRIDGHTNIETDYVARCVAALDRTCADGVGGPMRAVGRGYVAKCVALATSSPLGIGNSAYRTSRYFKERSVETTHMGAYRKQTLLDIGLFNESLVRHQDYELDYRIRQRGGAIFLAPDIRSTYFVRGSLPKLWRQYFQYGFWKGRFLRMNPGSLRLRHAIPPLFILALVFGAVIAPLAPPLTAIPLALVVMLYLLFLLLAAIISARGSKRKHLVLLPLVFAILHVSWGVGAWAGLLLPEALSPKRWHR